PDGEGDEVYANAKKEMERLIDEEIILQDRESSIYIYHQESRDLGHEGIIVGVNIRDYDEGRIKIHEYTREKPLEDLNEKKVERITKTLYIFKSLSYPRYFCLLSLIGSVNFE
ncbi:MAG: DUF1015 family protein, partial [Candidatus Lokiarchaeota archaeon]|nr:DUF1015 family protein [Candidatus Lokiarchaeota archaeon]